MITNQKRFRARCARYGITPEEFVGMLYVQNFRCKICRKILEIEGVGKSAIDHDHDTKKVRGILCGDCNMVLGRVESKGTDNFLAYLATPFNIGWCDPNPPGKNRKGRRRGAKGAKPAMTSAERVAAHRARKKAQGGK